MSLLVAYHLDEHLPALADDVPGTDPVHPPDLGSGDVWARCAVLHEAVAGRVATEVARRDPGSGGPLVVVTGDCLIAVGTLAGLHRAGIGAGVVWFDAHGDVQTRETSASGYPAGMVLRIIAGYRPRGYAVPSGMRPVPGTDLVLVDARDLDPPEVTYLAGPGPRRVEVTDLGADDVPAGPVLLHVDLDVVDADVLPGLRYPVTPGPTAREVADAVRRVLATGRVAALEIAATWYPGRAGEAGRRLIADLLAGAG